jgi:hypothetical protein
VRSRANADELNGNRGEDTVHGGADGDWVLGGQGNDLVFGDDGDDPMVNGNIGNDIVHGGAGNDSVYGGQNDDQVFGDDGNDYLSGDLGSDTLTGGAGADTFHLGAKSGHDYVTDFNAAQGGRNHPAVESRIAYSPTSVSSRYVLIWRWAMADGGEGVSAIRGRAPAGAWVATCGCCGVETALDRRRLAALLDAGVSLRRLETQLRCTCGARRGRIERSLPGTAGGEGDGLVYLFGP